MSWDDQKMEEWCQLHLVFDAEPTKINEILGPNIHQGSNYIYQEERFSEITTEFAPFIQIHWDELGLNKEAVPIDFDWQRYLQLDQEGKLVMTTVRRPCGIDENGVKYNKLIGYHISIIGTHLHYKSTMHAFVDVYYVLKQYRNGKVGARLFVQAEKDLKARGVKKILTGCKIGHDRGKLLEALGFVATDRQYTKIIG